MTSVVNSDDPPAEKKGSVTPVVGTSPDGDRHVQEGLQGQRGCQPECDVVGELVARLQRDAVSPPGKKREEGQHEKRPEEPRLFADDRVDEIRVGHRQGAELCRAAAEALPEETAGNERRLGGDDLVAGPRAVRRKVEEGQEALHAVLPREQEEKAQREREERHEEELDEPHARDVHHRKAGHQHEYRRGVVVLQEDDSREQAGHDERRDQHVHSATVPRGFVATVSRGFVATGFVAAECLRRHPRNPARRQPKRSLSPARRGARSTRPGRGPGSASPAPTAGTKTRRA